MSYISLTGSVFHMDATTVRRIVTVCHPNVDPQAVPTRPASRGTLFEITDHKTITAVATDSRTMAVVEGDYECHCTPDEIVHEDLIGNRVSIDLTKLYGARARLNAKSGPIGVRFGVNSVTFDWVNDRGSLTKRKSISIDCPIVEGKFPNWRQVVPKGKSPDMTMLIDPAKFMDVWKNRQDNVAHRFEVSDETIMGKGVKPSFYLLAELMPYQLNFPVESVDGGDSVCLNMELLVRFMRAAAEGKAKKVELRTFGPDDPITAVIPMIDAFDVKFICMPIARRQ